MSLTPPPSYVLLSPNNNTHHDTSSISLMENLKPSLIIIILILIITVLLSISLCLLLRHLNRRCLRRLSTVSFSDSRGVSGHRVSPDNHAFSVIDSLPLFNFSSVTRRSATGGDCAICLFKFEPDDQLRLLPLCCHAFHARCIDTWLGSNLTCPLCRSPITATETDVLKAMQASSADGTDSFRLEIGSVSRRQAANELVGESHRHSYSLGSFDYIVDEESDVTTSEIYRRTAGEKEEAAMEIGLEPSLASEVAAGRSWLKDYVDRLSLSLSSRGVSFRSSGRFFTGSSRRGDVVGVGEYDVEANRVGEEISEFFRWFSGV